jgi:hypothetical protein
VVGRRAGDVGRRRADVGVDLRLRPISTSGTTRGRRCSLPSVGRSWLSPPWRSGWWGPSPPATRPPPRIVGAAVAAGGIAIQAWALLDSGQRIDRSAHEAIVITLEVWAALLVVVAIVLRLGTAAVRSTDDESIRETDSVVFPVASALWIVVWLVVHLAPRWT